MIETIYEGTSAQLKNIVEELVCAVLEDVGYYEGDYSREDAKKDASEWVKKHFVLNRDQAIAKGYIIPKEDKQNGKDNNN